MDINVKFEPHPTVQVGDVYVNRGMKGSVVLLVVSGLDSYAYSLVDLTHSSTIRSFKVTDELESWLRINSYERHDKVTLTVIK